MSVSLVLLLLLGAIAGSFLNALIYRLKIDKPISRGRSQCDHCGHVLAPFDLIPVVSWTLLHGRCRYCAKPIGADQPLVELATAGLFGASYLVLAPAGSYQWTQLGLWLGVLSCLIFLAVYDLRWFLLPDKVLLPAMALAMVGVGVVALQAGSFGVVASHILAGAIAGGIFYALAAASGGKWLGGGDIKLAFTMGLLLGPVPTLLAMLLAFNSAAVIGLGLIAIRLRTRKDMIPFGPFLVAGTIVAYLWGQPLIDWYMSLTGLGLL